MPDIENLEREFESLTLREQGRFLRKQTGVWLLSVIRRLGCIAGHKDEEITTGYFGYKTCRRCRRKVELY